MKIKGKNAIVTGAGRGIGKAIAIALAKNNVSVSLASRDKEDLDEVSRMIESFGGSSIVIPTDVTEEMQVKDMVKKTVSIFGGVDILINNSGIAGPTEYVHNISLKEWEDTLSVNLTGAFLCCHNVVPHMIKQKWGRIINIGSATGKRPRPMRTPYCTSKMGIIGLTRSLAMELGNYGITANTICPGAVIGPRLDEVVQKISKTEGISESKTKELMTLTSPLKKLVNVEDIANMAVFLASEAAKNMTGQDINVSAGTVMN